MISLATWTSVVSIWQSCGANALPVMPQWRAEYDGNLRWAAENNRANDSTIACAGSAELFRLDSSTGLRIGDPLPTDEAPRLAGFSDGRAYVYDRWGVYCLSESASGDSKSWRSDAIRTGRGSDDGDPEFLQVLVDAAPLPDGVAVLRSDGLLCELSVLDGSLKWRRALGPLDNPRLLAGNEWLCVFHSLAGKSRAAVIHLQSSDVTTGMIDISKTEANEPLAAWACGTGLVLAWAEHWAVQPWDVETGERRDYAFPPGVRGVRAKMDLWRPRDERILDNSELIVAGEDGTVYGGLVRGGHYRTVGSISRERMTQCAALRVQGNAAVAYGPCAIFSMELGPKSIAQMQTFESPGRIEIESFDKRQILGFVRSPGDEASERLWFLIDYSDGSGATNKIRPLMTRLDVRSVLWLEKSLILVGPDEIQCFAR